MPPLVQPGRVDRDPHRVASRAIVAISRSRPARGMCGSTPGCRDDERGARRRARREPAASTSGIGRVAAHQERRVGGGDVERRLDARARVPSSPGHTRLSEEAPVAGIRRRRAE